jgi:predicted nucleic acid-binding protein
VVIVDTTVWVDYLRGEQNPHTDWVDAQLGLQPLGIADIILCEVLQGVPDEAAAAAVERQFNQFHVFDLGGADLARAAARNYRALRRQGKTVRKTIDCVIATFCLREGHALLHRDRDFDAFEQLLGLSVIHP